MKKFIKRTISLLLVFILCFALCGCDTWDNFRKAFIDPKENVVHTIKIGVLEPKSGRQSYDAEDELAGIELAYSLFNTIGDYKIELVVEDNHSDITGCADSAKRLIDQGCALIIGSYSDTLSLAASDAIKEAKIPAIAASCTVPILTLSNEYYYRASCINSYDTAGAADYVFYSLSQDRCAIFLQEGSDYQQNKADLFKSEFIDLCGKETIEFKIEEHDEESDSTFIKIEEIPSVRFVYITGEETEEDFEVLFSDLEKYGYMSFYSAQSKSEAIPAILASFLHFEEEPIEEPEEPEEPDNPEQPVDPEEPISPGKPGEEPEEPEEPDNPDEPGEEEPELPKPHFSWIGTDLWSDIEEYVLENESYGKNFFLKYVSFTVEYDSLVSQSEMFTTFSNAFKEKYGEESSPSNLCALGFDAYLIAYNALVDTVEYVDGPLQKNPLIIENNKSSEEESGMQESNNPGGSLGNNTATGNFNNEDIFKPKDPVEEIKLFDDADVFNRTLLNEMLKKLKNMAGATGTISINENGDPVKDILVKDCALPGYVVSYSVVPGSEPVKIETEEEQDSDKPSEDEDEGQDDSSKAN